MKHPTTKIRTLFQFNSRRVLLWFLDILLGVLSLYLAFLLRYDGSIPDSKLGLFFSLLPIVVIGRAATYLYFGFYSRFWEYSSLEDLYQILKAVVAGSFLILTFTFFYNRAVEIPRYLLVMDMLLLILLLGGSRLIWRLLRERFKRQSHASPSIPALIYGANDSGAGLLQFIQNGPLPYRILGFIDDDPKKLNTLLRGIRVLGQREDIEDLARSLEARELLVSTANLTPEDLKEIVGMGERAGLHCKLISSVMDLSTRQVRISKIRQVEINDLLEREAVSLDFISINQLLENKSVLVTGAGGSIGSELCRQILSYNPSRLILLDRGENYLFELKNQLENTAPQTEKHFMFASITNQKKMEQVFSRFRPQIVFHAAAHKHVPLMEEHPDEAVLNNIYGTRITAECALKFQTRMFVLVSTDKVVKPTSVMGMTKKIAENYVSSLSGSPATRFVTVRFGNVLGSNGSVVPLFKKQIEAGGPVTVTHPEMRRYFMLISEAAQLVLQAAAMGQGGEIFILEMGAPVKIVNLARKMISLYGYKPDEEIKIVFTGTRPGEKLQEELTEDYEKSQPTFHEKIKIARSELHVPADYAKKIDCLLEIARRGHPDEIRKELKHLIDAIDSPSTGPLKQSISLPT